MNRVALGVTLGFVVGTAIWLGLPYVQPRDTVLPGALDFAVSAPEVKRRVGSEPTTDVYSRQYAVAREGWYREYGILVSGSRGNAHVRVRAVPVESQRQWSYEIVSLE